MVSFTPQQSEWIVARIEPLIRELERGAALEGAFGLHGSSARTVLAGLVGVSEKVRAMATAEKDAEIERMRAVVEAAKAVLAAHDAEPSEGDLSAVEYMRWERVQGPVRELCALLREPGK